MWLILPARTRKKDYAPRRFRRASFHVGGALGDNIPLKWRISDFTRPRTWERRAAAGKRLAGLFFGNGGTRAKVASAFIGFFLFLWRLTPQEKQLDVRTTEENDCSIWFNRDEDVFRPPPVQLQIIYPPPKQHKAHLQTQIRPTIALHISRSRQQRQWALTQRHLRGQETMGGLG